MDANRSLVFYPLLTRQLPKLVQLEEVKKGRIKGTPGRSMLLYVVPDFLVCRSVIKQKYCSDSL